MKLREIKSDLPFKHGWKIVFGLALGLGLLIYSNTLNVPFQFDDHTSIETNTSVHQGADAVTVWKTNPVTRFLPTLSFAANYALARSTFTGYHLINLGIHILNAFWVYLLISLLLITPKMKGKYSEKACFLMAAFSAMLFLAHPLQTQAVTYIVQRIASMAAFFYLGAIVFYVKSRLEENRIHYGLALAMTVAAMFCKENAFTLPFAIALVEAMFFGFPEGKRKALIRLLPFLVTLIIIPYFTYSDSSRLELSRNAWLPMQKRALSRGSYFLTQLNVLCTYLRLFLLPVNQNVDYDYPASHSLLEPKTLCCFLLLSAIFMAGIWMVKRNRLIAFSIFWFFLTLSVESTIIPINDIIFEHRMYLPIVGCSFCLAAGLYSLFKKHNAFLTSGILIVLLFSSMSYVRNHVWLSEISLWKDVIQKSPHKSRGYNNLGSAYDHLKDPATAKKLYLQAIEIDPGDALGHFNLGRSLDREGNTDAAIKQYEKAIALDASTLDAYNNLAIIYGRQNNLARAIEILEKVISISPEFVRAYGNLGVFYHQQGNIEKAVTNLERARELNPYDPLSYCNLGIILKERGEPRAAIALLQKAYEMNPFDGETTCSLGEAFAQTGDFRSAAILLKQLKTLGQRDKAERLAKQLSPQQTPSKTPENPSKNIRH